VGGFLFVRVLAFEKNFIKNFALSVFSSENKYSAYKCLNQAIYSML